MLCLSWFYIYVRIEMGVLMVSLFILSCLRFHLLKYCSHMGLSWLDSYVFGY